MILKPTRKHGSTWHHFGCRVCGNVFMLPSTGEPDDRPYCWHGGNYSWRADVEGKWTRMEYATVTLPDPDDGETRKFPHPDGKGGIVICDAAGEPAAIVDDES